MTDHEFWAELYRRFDPMRSADAEQRAPNLYSPAEQILSDLALSMEDREHARVLLYGMTGSGKTTELLHIARQSTSSSLVVYLDILQHFAGAVGSEAALDEVRPWEVLFLVGLAVLRAGGDKLSHRFDPEVVDAFEQASRALLPTATGGKLDLASLASQVLLTVGGAVSAAEPVSGAALQVLARVPGAVRGWDVPLGRRGSPDRDDQEPPVQRLLGAVRRLVEDLERGSPHPPLLLIDGLDRAQSAETTIRLFCRSSLLAELPCATVLAAPIHLRRRGLAKLRGFDPAVLANVPVLAHDDPAADGPGLATCLEILSRRVDDLPDAQVRFPPDQRRRIARMSGGILRDLMRLSRHVSREARRTAARIATAEIVDGAIDTLRRTVEEGWDAGARRDLEGVMRDPRHELPDIQNERLDRLLLSQWLLPYPNDSVWWYPHPLLLAYKLQSVEP